MLKILFSIFIAIIIISISSPFVFASPQATTESQLTVVLPSLDATGAVLIEQSTGNVLFEKEKDKQLYPASTTKILAALVAIETGNLDEIVIVGNEANLAPLDGSKAGLDIGEQITLKNLIKGFMLASGNDAGYTIAVHVGRKLSENPELSIRESIEVFTDLMNKRAAQIGANNSQFLNPHGYHQEGHFTTAYDLALISREAMNNEVFRDLVSQRIVEYPDWSSSQDDSIQSEIRYWISRNRLINPESEFYYPYATGIKTGWTIPAGPCLVSSAYKNGISLISVVLNTSREGQWLDSRELFDYGFETFTFHRLVERNQPMGLVDIENYKLDGKSEVNLVTQNGFENLFRKSDLQNISRSIQWLYNCPEGNPRIVAPISKGQTIGVLKFILNGTTVFETNLLATESIEKRTVISTIVYRVENNSFLYVFLQTIAGLLISIFILRFVIKLKKRLKIKKKLTYH